MTEFVSAVPKQAVVEKETNSILDMPVLRVLRLLAHMLNVRVKSI